MRLKPCVKAQYILKECTAVVTRITDRQANLKYHNEADVENYPKEVSFVVIADKTGNNLGRSFKIKLRNTDTIAPQQTIDFAKYDVVNGKATFWADQKKFVQVSIKGDEIIEHK